MATKIKLNKDMVDAPVVETPVVETPVVETPVVETPVVETPVVETPVVETPVVESKAEVSFPVVKGNGKFQAVVVGEQFAVYNPDGQRVTGLVSFSQASDVVRQQNQAASIKG